MPLEQRVDERGDCRSLAQYQEAAKQNRNDHDRQQPIFLALAQEPPEFGQERHPLCSSISIGSSSIRRWVPADFDGASRTSRFPAAVAGCLCRANALSK